MNPLKKLLTTSAICLSVAFNANAQWTFSKADDWEKGRFSFSCVTSNDYRPSEFCVRYHNGAIDYLIETVAKHRE